MLLRKVFCETEKLNEEELEAAKTKLEENKEALAGSENPLDIMNYKVQEVKPFSMEEFMRQHQQDKE